MKVYADKEFYCSTYAGAVPENLLERALVSASRYLHAVTLGKADSFEGDELKYAVCEAADLYYRICIRQERNIKSENNDGYSVTYVTEQTDGESLESLFQRQAYGIARKWLLTTGIMNRRAGYAYDHKCGYHNL